MKSSTDSPRYPSQVSSQARIQARIRQEKGDLWEIEAACCLIVLIAFQCFIDQCPYRSELSNVIGRVALSIIFLFSAVPFPISQPDKAPL